MSWLWRLLPLLFGVFALSSPLVMARDDIADVVSATFKVTNPNSTATCFVISRPAEENQQRELILVTAAHVLEQMSGDECRIVLREESADGTFVRKEEPLKIRVEGQPLWTRHPELDVAALKMEIPAGSVMAAFDLDQLADETVVTGGRLQSAADVLVPCYPAQLEGHPAGFPVLRGGAVATFPLAPIEDNQTFLVDYTSFGGDSGAPVVVVAREAPDRPPVRPLIVGLVIGQHLETTTTTSPSGENTVHRPMGLAIVVHADFIRQTIDLLP